MADLNPSKISSAAFDPDYFVRELTKPSVGVDGLLLARQKVQSLADETNAMLKKNVYKNYALFIDTAKEISFLKSEMYQLSHLLNEEQSILNCLLDTSISGDKNHGLTVNEKKEVAAKYHEDPMISFTLTKSRSVQPLDDQLATNFKELNSVLDKIEGASGILETKHRMLIYSGELVELDANEYKPLDNQGTIFGVILNDCLIIACSYPQSVRSGKKYKFQSLYELDNIAVINVKDPNFKTAFKILMFPQTRVFKLETVENKKKWLESFDQAKKQRKASLQRRDSIMFIPNMSMDSSGGSQSGSKTSPIDRPYSSLHNPFEESELLDDVSETDTETIPLWLVEIPEDLDVCIAQRNFEDAVGLVHKVNDHFAFYPKCCDTALQMDLKLRINHKINELITSVANELKISADRSLQSGPRTARRAVHLLIKLGKVSLATKLFLDQRSSQLKFCLRQQKSEGATIPYIKRISSVFFTNVHETCKEFQKAFDFTTLSNQSNVCSDNISLNSEKINLNSIFFAPALSCLICFVKEKLKNFLTLFSRQVLATQVPLSVTAESISIIRYQCRKLETVVGIDLLFILDCQIKLGLEKIVNEIKEKLVEGIKSRANEDKWQPHQFTTKAGLSKFLQEIKDLGLSNINKYMYDDVRISLTSNSIIFAKAYLDTVSDFCKLSIPFNKTLLEEVLVSIFKLHMKHIDKSLKADHLKSERKFIRRNALFVLENVLPLAVQIYQEKLTNNYNLLSKLENDYIQIVQQYSEDFKSPDKKRGSKTTINITESKTISSTTFL